MDYGQLALATMALNRESWVGAWGKVLIPSVLNVLATIGTGWTVFWLTTRKENAALRRRAARVEDLGKLTWVRLTDVVTELRQVNTYLEHQRLETKLEGLCEFCEISTQDAYEFNFGRDFSGFIKLKKSARVFLEQVRELGAHGAYRSSFLNSHMQHHRIDFVSGSTKRIKSDLAEYEANFLMFNGVNSAKDLLGFNL